MRLPRVSLSVAGMTAGILVLMAGEALAFHDGGAAACGTCHITHEDPRSTSGQQRFSPEWQLRAATPSDLCLMCHAKNFGAVLGQSPLVPPEEIGAGNFVFLSEDNINDSPGGALMPILGDSAGHNLVAPGYGLDFDPRYTFSPGGTFPAQSMGCTSCHDPHGTDSFRLLHGQGPVMDGLADFSDPAPVAEGIALGEGAELRTNHTAYISGMSAWCGNCHGHYHEGGRSAFQHPTDEELGLDERDQYNAYEGESNPLGGSIRTAYIPEIPFESPDASVESRSGPENLGRVMCLSCHRAHASSAPGGLRWDFNVSLLDDDGFVSGSYAIPSPYPGPEQGTLCRKCHETPESDDSDSIHRLLMQQ